MVGRAQYAPFDPRPAEHCRRDLWRLPPLGRGAGTTPCAHDEPSRGAPLVASPTFVTVGAQSCAEPDAWATALMVLGADVGAALASERGLAALFLLREEDGSE